jgi:hypothetical protein
MSDPQEKFPFLKFTRVRLPTGHLGNVALWEEDGVIAVDVEPGSRGRLVRFSREEQETIEDLDALFESLNPGDQIRFITGLHKERSGTVIRKRAEGVPRILEVELTDFDRVVTTSVDDISRVPTVVQQAGVKRKSC